MALLILKKSWEFDLVFRTGLRVQGELVRLLFVRDEAGPLRVGFAVGRRQGKAHIRNRGRRILREAFRRLAPQLDGMICVLSLTKRGLDAKADDVFREMASMFRRRGMLKGPVKW